MEDSLNDTRARGRNAHGEQSTAKAMGEDPTSRAVARYLADMTSQLESMAGAARLELLAYLLAMARAEAERIASDRPPPKKA